MTLIRVFLIISIFLTMNSFAISKDLVIEAKKKAILKISLFSKTTNLQVGVGTGFFINEHGDVITNFHVMEDFLKDMSSYKISITNAEGGSAENIKVIKCSSNDKIDLCLLNIEGFKDYKFFNVQNNVPAKIENAIFYGFSRGNDFKAQPVTVGETTVNISEKMGATKDIQDNLNLKSIELLKLDCSSKPCGGNSGGPVFNPDNGDLIGVFTEGYRKGSRIFALETTEAYKFINSDNKFKQINISKEIIIVPKKKFRVGDEFDDEK